MTVKWYAIQTNPRCENRAALGLEGKGFPVVAPIRKKWIRKARKQQISEQPLFPRYVFVGLRFESDFDAVRRTDGVFSFVRGANGGYPAQIETEAVQNIQLCHKAGYWDETRAVLNLPPGGLLKIMEGPFAGMLARLKAADKAECRVSILLSMLGKQHEVDVPLRSVEPEGLT